MIIDRSSLQPNIRRQIEYYEKKCLQKDIKKEIVLLILGVIIGLNEYFDIISWFPEGSTIGSIVSAFMILSTIGLILTSVKNIYKINSKGGYSLVFGELSDIQTTKQKDKKSQNRYKHTIIVDHLKLEASSQRFITKDFKHIYLDRIFVQNLRRIFPIHTMRLYFFDMETREVIFDLTDFIRL